MFTKGPWEVVSRSDQWTDIKPLGAEHEYAAIAMVSDLGEQAGKMEANANLIAAAPDLLAACEEMLLKLVAQSCETFETFCTESGIGKRAQAAIAKATGKS